MNITIKEIKEYIIKNHQTYVDKTSEYNSHKWTYETEYVCASFVENTEESRDYYTLCGLEPCNFLLQFEETGPLGYAGLRFELNSLDEPHDINQILKDLKNHKMEECSKLFLHILKEIECSMLEQQLPKNTKEKNNKSKI